MIYRQLGKTPFQVSKICFGALTIGPLQAGLSIRAGAEVIRTAVDLGINFIDTADLYETYPYIKEGLKGSQREVVISSKSYDYTAAGMAKSLEKARRELDRDWIEIFSLHEQETALTIQGHWPAVEYLLEAKAKGIVGAVGISTHAVEVVRTVAGIKEIEVIHPILNMRGLGILDGTVDEMLEAVSICAQAGKGIYGMKAIGGGNLIGDAKAALGWAYQLSDVQSFAVGMKSAPEVRVNVAWALGEDPDPGDLVSLSKEKRVLHIDDWCLGCGRCVEACPQKALSIQNKKAVVDPGKCLFCGYCAPRCRDFCIKVI